MLNWSEKEIAWYKAAQANSNYFEQLADLAELPHGMAVHDLGCGIGSLAACLLRRGHPVTAVDQSADAIAEVARLGLPITTLVADYRTLAGPIPYPIFCLCGDLREDFRLFAQWQSRIVTIIALDDTVLPFRLTTTPRRANSSAEYQQFLETSSLSFRATALQAEFGQPFLDEKDARDFVAHHNSDATPEAIDRYLRDKLEPPCFLPSTKRVTLFRIFL